LSAGNDQEFIDFQQSKEKGGRSMKCPLSITGQIGYEKEFIGAAADCLKEECAWWHEGLKACSIYLIQEQLALVFGTLREPVDKMPHEEQFRR